MYTAVLRWHRPRKRWTRPHRWVPRRFGDYLLVGVAATARVLYAPYRGFWATHVFRGSGDRGEVVRSSIDWRSWMKKKSVPSASLTGGPTHAAAMESNVLGSLPNIVSHCAVTRYDDGSTRRTGWITVKTMGPTWVVAVKDPDGCCQLNCTGPTLDDALALADVLLGSDSAPWEPDPFMVKAGYGKKK